MQFLTYDDYLTKVNQDLDLEGETIIQASEMMGYCNEGIHLVETIIHELREDYFLACYDVPLVEGTEDYDLPSNMFANKIRGLLYNDGTRKYEVKKIKKLAEMMHIEPTDDYRRIIVNTSTANRFKLRLCPASRVTSSTVMDLWYLRSANKVTSASDIIDIPEFYMYILTVMKIRCKEKEQLDPTWAATQLEKLEQNLRNVLRDKDEDEDSELPMDTSFFDDFNSSIMGA